MFNLKQGDIGVIPFNVCSSPSFRRINPHTYDKFLLPGGGIVVIRAVLPSATYVRERLLISEIVNACQRDNPHIWCKVFPDDLEIIKFK